MHFNRLVSVLLFIYFLLFCTCLTWHAESVTEAAFYMINKCSFILLLHARWSLLNDSPHTWGSLSHCCFAISWQPEGFIHLSLPPLIFILVFKDSVCFCFYYNKLRTNCHIHILSVCFLQWEPYTDPHHWMCSKFANALLCACLTTLFFSCLVQFFFFIAAASVVSVFEVLWVE